MPRPRIEDNYSYMTSTYVCRKLGITEYQLNTRIARSIFPAPTKVDQQGVRYFDENWLRAAREALEKWKEKEVNHVN